MTPLNVRGISAFSRYQSVLVVVLWKCKVVSAVDQSASKHSRNRKCGEIQACWRVALSRREQQWRAGPVSERHGAENICGNGPCATERCAGHEHSRDREKDKKVSPELESFGWGERCSTTALRSEITTSRMLLGAYQWTFVFCATRQNTHVAAAVVVILTHVSNTAFCRIVMLMCFAVSLCILMSCCLITSRNSMKVKHWRNGR